MIDVNNIIEYSIFFEVLTRNGAFHTCLLNRFLFAITFSRVIALALILFVPLGHVVSTALVIPLLLSSWLLLLSHLVLLSRLLL